LEHVVTREGTVCLEQTGHTSRTSIGHLLEAQSQTGSHRWNGGRTRTARHTVPWPVRSMSDDPLVLSDLVLSGPCGSRRPIGFLGNVRTGRSTNRFIRADGRLAQLDSMASRAYRSFQSSNAPHVSLLMFQDKATRGDKRVAIWPRPTRTRLKLPFWPLNFFCFEGSLILQW